MWATPLPRLFRSCTRFLRLPSIASSNTREMGFCRRCGNIVVGERCRCGGLAVAPVVSFNKSDTKEQSQDPWSKTYVSRERSPARPINHDSPAPTITPPSTQSTPLTSSLANKKFPRPLSAYTARTTALDSRVSAHIASTSTFTPTLTKRPSLLSPESQTDILPSLHSNDTTLSKVYGSVLQPKETLTTHSCAICSSPFLPDTTIYPDPTSESPSSTRFLCRPCFIINGGSKGACPNCSRPVIILKSEGGYIHAAGQYWHKQCFNCAGCFKNLGDNPMVDLLGRPSCADCFDTCLNRDSDRRLSRSPPKDAAPTPKNNLGGLTISSKEGKSRESSPAIEELEQRLGISRSREPSPSITTSRGEPLPYGRGPSPSPVSRFPTQPDIIRETNSLDRIRSLGSTGSSDAVSGRFGGLDKLVSSPKQIGDGSPRVHNRLHDKLLDLTNVSSSITSPTIKDPPTPNLAYEVSKHSASPRVEILPRRKFDLEALLTKPTANTVPLKEPIKQPSAKETLRQYPANSPKYTFKLDQSALCAGCSGPLFSVRDGGKFITVPGENGEEPSVYHTACFKCVVCRDLFRETGGGQAAFVKTETGPSHLDCTSPQKAPVRRSRSTSTPNIPPPSPQTPAPVAVAPQVSSSRVDRTSTAAPATPTFPRFGSRTSCPGCQKTVSPMEMGVVPGPQGTKWHASCLVCGGRRRPRSNSLLAKPREDRQAVPGCGKRLDSAAKSDGDGGVWCRECLLLLGIGGSPQASPQRSTTPLSSQTMPILTRKPTTHTTGNTTLARQLTGGDNTLLRQMTGGGSSPTKQLSSTGVVRPRPKSVIGMRTTRSIDLSGGRTYLMNSLDK